ncbi:MAG: phosphatidylserine/phosphatidylglycerophosphate/cardiolipin synthase family protein [bacterium]|nr:MAG: phosphatidylserine/phosphatidylglycerophosphate/cardiolipin synthase family protein [bacterium]
MFRTSAVLLTLCMVLVPACASDRVIRKEISDSPLLEASLAAEEGRIGLEATEAYFDGHRLFVKYLLGDLVCYAVGEWDDPENLIILTRLRTDATVGGLALPLEKHTTKPWKNRPKSLPPLFILGKADWDRILAEILAEILPADLLMGVLVDVFRKEYFLYRDEKGRPRVTLLRDKPAMVGIDGVWSFSDLLDVSLTLLEHDLESKGIHSRQMVINTGDAGLYAYPFLYVDLENRFVLFAQVNPTSSIVRRYFTQRDLQVAGHLIGSHAAVVVRPITSIGRLLYLLVDTAYDLGESILDLGLDVISAPFRAVSAPEPIPPLAGGPGMDLERWERWLDTLTASKTSWGTMELLIDGEEYFPRLIEAITEAQDSVHIRTYIFDNDDYAVTIADILKDRSHKVDIRVMIDGFGTILATRAHPETLPLDHRPPASVTAYLKAGSGVKVRKQTNPWLTVDHSKVTIIDGRSAFVGGMNIGREYRYERHDIMVELKGPVAAALQEDFNRVWMHSGWLGDFALFPHLALSGARTEEVEGYPIRILFSRAADPEIYRAQIEAIKRSGEYIYVENMYFTDDNIIQKLIKARRRGVDVRVIIPLEGFMGPFDRANILAANLMMENGIRVYVYPGVLHAKAAVFDGWACLGSANFDKASFVRNREVNIATSHPEAVNNLIERLFKPDFEISKELTEPIPEKWTDRIAEIITDQL